MKNLVITIEGQQGDGKTTAAEIIKTALIQNNREKVEVFIREETELLSDRKPYENVAPVDAINPIIIRTRQTDRKPYSKASQSPVYEIMPEGSNWAEVNKITYDNWPGAKRIIHVISKTKCKQ